MINKTLVESHQLKPPWIGAACLTLFLLSWALYAVGLSELSKKNTYTLYREMFPNKTETQSTLPETPEALETLLPTPVLPQSQEEYNMRRKAASQHLSKLQTALALPRNAKLEFILGRAVQEGLLHPLHATQIQKEYQVLAESNPESWQ
jgi:hypothetical protein